MIEFRDQLHRSVILHDSPKKIISLVPSQSELLNDLGLEKEVIGITKFCVHPPHWKNEKQIIGGTKNLNLKKIKSLKPDLIIANKEENNQDQILDLANEFPVWISDVYDLESALKMIDSVGTITDTSKKSTQLISDIRIGFSTLPKLHSNKKTIYLIWKDPFLSIGADTFIHDMLKKCGFQNYLSDKERYPEVSIEKLKIINPEILLLSSEPYPFTAVHISELQNYFKSTNIYLVDGEMFSWYGSRLVKAPDYFSTLVREMNSAS